ELNRTFEQVFATNDGSGVTFSKATPARDGIIDLFPRLTTHPAFMPQIPTGDSPDVAAQQRKQAVRLTRESVLIKQTAEIVELVRGYAGAVEHARRSGEKFRVAVLGRTRKVLDPIASALRDARVPFR